MADVEIKIVEADEDIETLEGAELLVSFFEFRGGIAIPKANIADKFDENTLKEVGTSVINGYNADLDSMEEWSEFVHNHHPTKRAPSQIA